jgi:hypothetical protein
MAATPKKVYLTDASLATIGPETLGSLAGRVNAILARYETIVQDGPAFTWAEWEHIILSLEAYHVVAERSDSWQFAWAEIAETPPCAGSTVDHVALAARVRTLPVAQQIALCEVVARWWGGEHGTGDAALLRRVGGRIAP